MHHQEIPIVNLKMQFDEKTQVYSESILNNEIKDVHIEHIAISNEKTKIESSKAGCKTIYLFVEGRGEVIATNTVYDIVPETIFLPNLVENFTVKVAKKNTLHYLKISCKLSPQDLVDLKELPTVNTQNIYYSKFEDCQAYTEKIKSPNTVSRTILNNKYIPRIAMGTVQTHGPDKVAAHEHPMLEQLFLGLAKNNCIVYADEAKVVFPQFSILHIPLGSRHAVSVEQNETMYYVWMDFFLDKKGEEWLKTHKVNDEKLSNK